MGLDERLSYILLGCAIGFVLGYMTKVAQDIKEIKDKVDEVDDIVKRDERGVARLPSWTGIKTWVGGLRVKDLALFLVVMLCAYSALQSQLNSNDVKNTQVAQASQTKQLKATQASLAMVTSCTQDYLSKTIVALNERTTFSKDQNQANINLQKAQADFVTNALQDPPLDPPRVRLALTRYFDFLKAYVDIALKSINKQTKNAYPTDEDFTKCVSPASTVKEK